MGSSYKLWDERLDGEVLTRGQIGQWCHAVASGAMGYRIGGHHTNLTEGECADLAMKFQRRCLDLDQGGYQLTKEQTDFGYDWLRTYDKRAQSVGITQEMLDTFSGFRFVDWKCVSVSDYGYWAQIIPIYRVLYQDGDVDYSWSPWQSKAYA